MNNMNLLMLEDSPDDAALIQTTLKRSGHKFNVKVVSERDEFIDALDSFHPEFILSDHRLPTFSSVKALEIARQKLPYVPFILITGAVSDEFASSIIKDGADDYLLKSNLNRLPTAIQQAIEKKQTEKAQALLVSIVTSSDSAIYSRTLDGIITSWNPGAEIHFGYSAEEAIGRDISFIIPPELLDEELEIMMKIRQGESVMHHETRRRKKNGELIHFSLTMSPIKDTQGNIVGVSKIARDITEQLKAVQQKEFDQDNLRSLINNTKDLMWSIDRNLKLITCNDAFYQMTKLTSGEQVKKGSDIPEDQFGKEQLKRYELLYERALSGEIFTETIYFDSPFEFWTEVSFYPIRHADAVIGTACFSRDITERKNAEEELKKSHERFDYATQASSDIIWELNFETKQSIVNEANENLAGVNIITDMKMGVAGKDIMEEDRKKVQQSFTEAKMDITRRLWDLEYRVWSQDHTVLTIINHAIFIRNKEGIAVRAIGAITDITEKKKLEAELFEQQRTAQIKITATALDAQEKERHAIAIELHDNVNQILVGVKLLLSLVVTNPKKNLHLLRSCIDHIQSAVCENRKISHALVAPDFKAKILTDQVFDLTDYMLKIAGVDVYVDIARFHDELLNDQQKLTVYRIIQEQCTNIVKYAKAGLVNISLSTEEGLFKMIIADDGVGMETGNKTKGIGLKNINGRLSIFNGTASITTAPGRGFALKIRMPLKKMASVPGSL
jgi:PAS domain S-box-containing protein